MNDSKQTTEPAFSIYYRFRFPDGKQRDFPINLDKDMNLINKNKESIRKWTKLSCQQCPNCPLDDKKYEFCPIAINIVPVLDFFAAYHACSECEIFIATDDRTYIKRGPLSQGITSLIGIFMVTSGCPLMDKLKPMVRFHLPFASKTETIYRATSMYLLAQYFLYKKGNGGDWKMSGLGDIYKEINTLNANFRKRISRISEQEDAAFSAIANLDCFAYSVQLNIDSETFKEIEHLFSAYWRPASKPSAQVINMEDQKEEEAKSDEENSEGEQGA